MAGGGTAPQPKAALAQGRRGDPARRHRQAADEPAPVELPARGRAVRARSPPRPSFSSTRCWSAPQRLLDERIIREITPIFDTRALGYESMLVAAKVDSENPHRAAKIINSHPGVSHNYLRTHEFNLWFTIATPPDSELGLEGTLEVLQRADRRRVDPPAPDADPVQDQHEPGDGAGHRRARRHRRGRAAARARGAALRRHRHRRDPRAPGADGGRSTAPTTRPRPRRSGCRRAVPRAPRGMVERKILRRVAAILYHRRAGFSANGMGVWRVPDEQILEVGARMAAVRGISHCYERPTYADWPYSVFTMAHGRSKEECDAILDSIADEHDLHGDDRAVLYSSTEFKKIRLHYFTDDYAEWEASARRRLVADARRSTGEPSDRLLDTRASEVLYARAVGLLPGGVNSPVRAMRSIGRDHPIFIERGEGFELIDVDGHRYVDWVCSWGPLILGHAHPAVVEAVQEAAGEGHLATARRPRPRSSWRPRSSDRVPLGGDGAAGQLGHRGVDERGAPGAGGHRPRHDREVRRRLPRPRRRPARRGRLGPGDAGDPGQPRGHRGAGRGHGRRALERRRGAGGGARRARGRRDPRRAGAGEHGPGPARRTASSELRPGAGRRARRAADPRRGDHRLSRRARRRPGAATG